VPDFITVSAVARAATDRTLADRLLVALRLHGGVLPRIEVRQRLTALGRERERAVRVVRGGRHLAQRLFERAGRRRGVRVVRRSPLLVQRHVDVLGELRGFLRGPRYYSDSIRLPFTLKSYTKQSGIS
jgi:hypothetical protein